jgi:heme O synthase-like polyprenyltransferase
MTPLVFALAVAGLVVLLLYAINQWLWTNPTSASARKTFNAVVIVLLIIVVLLILFGVLHPIILIR